MLAKLHTGDGDLVCVVCDGGDPATLFVMHHLSRQTGFHTAKRGPGRGCWEPVDAPAGMQLEKAAPLVIDAPAQLIADAFPDGSVTSLGGRQVAQYHNKWGGTTYVDTTSGEQAHKDDKERTLWVCHDCHTERWFGANDQYRLDGTCCGSGLMRGLAGEQRSKAWMGWKP